MTDLYLYGAGKNGKEARELIEEEFNNEYCVKAFLDTNKSGDYCGLPIKKAEELRKSKEDNIVITVGNVDSVAEIYMFLYKQGFKHIYWMNWLKIKNAKNVDFLKNCCIDTKDWGNCILPHMELHIADKCNLNCKGCTHFSPLFDDLGPGYEQIMSDVKKVAGIFSNVLRLDILGGEPLLNPELPRYLSAIREILPHATIDIFTNGLLIPKLDEDDFRVMRENDIFISITEYKPTHAMIDKIIACLEENAIDYNIVPYDNRQKFNTPISLSANSKYPQMCISDGCVTVADGKICRCPTLMYMPQFNKYFNQNLPTDGIMELDDISSGEELLQKLKEDIPLCKHCIKHEIEWSVCGRDIKLEDFAVED